MDQHALRHLQLTLLSWSAMAMMPGSLVRMRILRKLANSLTGTVKAPQQPCDKTRAGHPSAARHCEARCRVGGAAMHCCLGASLTRARRVLLDLLQQLFVGGQVRIAEVELNLNQLQLRMDTSACMHAHTLWGVCRVANHPCMRSCREARGAPIRMSLASARSAPA